jgi:ATP-dependent DNA helicase RecQ
VCVDAAGVSAAVSSARSDLASRARERVTQRRVDLAVQLTETDVGTVLGFVGAMHRPCGKRLIAQGLRGSTARMVKRRKLHENQHYGALSAIPELALVAAIESLLAEGRLAPKGKKYPTVWLPGKPVRGADPARPKPQRATGIEAALKEFRKKESRKRRWRAYQVFDNRTLSAIAEQRPASPEALASIPGLGPKRIEKFGERILELVRSFG